MTTANVLQASASGLPPVLKAAQEAMHFPEVQEMLRRLSEYRLGIFMPHQHDEQTGEFQPLSDGVMQVESGLEVSFRSMAEVASQPHRFLPVGWVWQGGVSTSVTACEMDEEEKPGETTRYIKHKM